MQEPASRLLYLLFSYFAGQCLFAAAWGPPIRRPVLKCPLCGPILHICENVCTLHYLFVPTRAVLCD